MGEKGEFCVAVSPVIREETAGILTWPI